MQAWVPRACLSMWGLALESQTCTWRWTLKSNTGVHIHLRGDVASSNLFFSVDSVGVEMERVRWMLSVHNHRHLLPTLPANNVAFLCEDIWNAKSFNPFTHVYMFDIGFPPKLFSYIADILRNSATVQVCGMSITACTSSFGFVSRVVRPLLP